MKTLVYFLLQFVAIVISFSALAQVSPPDCSRCGNPYTSGCLPLPPSFPSYYSAAPPDVRALVDHAVPKCSAVDTANDYHPAVLPSRLTIQAQIRNQEQVQTKVVANYEEHKVVAAVVAANPTHNCNCTIKTPVISEPPPAPPTPTLEPLRSNGSGCTVDSVTSLPGSHLVGSDLIADMSSPDPKHPNVVYGITADVGSSLAEKDKALYVSKSEDGGKTWHELAKVGTEFMNFYKEGLRNGISVSPDGKDIVITSQKGAYQVKVQPGSTDAVVTHIDGPSSQDVMAGQVKITIDEQRVEHMIVGYGYHDGHPQIISYHKDGDSWVKDGMLPTLPNSTDILNLQYDPKNSKSVYVGMGDQAYHLNPQTHKWDHISGVGKDSAVQGLSTVGGLHIATCWGVYNGSSDHLTKVANEKLRAYDFQVNPNDSNEAVLTTSTGVYYSKDGGSHWAHFTGKPNLPDKPPNEFRTAHFSDDGSVIVSGIPGTFSINPFSSQCSGSSR